MKSINEFPKEARDTVNAILARAAERKSQDKGGTRSA